jgi:cation transport regulator
VLVANRDGIYPPRPDSSPFARQAGGQGIDGADEQPIRRFWDVPYKQITQLPDNVKNNLPKHAQEIYKEAFNSAEDQYGEEDRAHRVAWSAVKQKYEKNAKGNWVQK